MDDLLVIADTIPQAMERLEKVLEVLTQAGFYLNLEKCSFIIKRVQYLGFEVEAGEIRPNPAKIEALTQLPPPKTVTELRQFIGLASYFRRFVPDFSKIMAPLFRMTSSKSGLDWTNEHEQIRKDVIRILTTAPVLMIFDQKHPIELHTDASSVGFGAILIHKVEGRPHVVEYFSKRTTPAESKYHSYELETLAVKYAVEHFRQYLMGNRFTVVTDCNSLRASRAKKRSFS
ncbi:unnamed protein product [Nesidiocoris tenuis]|uniref:Reverse transcriptase domain-containing protein n=1 Tax=Nesidiocoris tenuis TaxID=355587 RepID=A0A6H5HLW4_9HEMI|nr:unnamed protein product [Nesidiocoris tenuis]